MQDDTSRRDLRPPPAIDVLGLAKLLAEGEPLLLIDIREPSERAICQLPNSQVLSMNDILRANHQLPKDQLLVIYCHYGIRSRMVVELLLQDGYGKVLNLDGGIDAWAERIDPKMPRY